MKPKPSLKALRAFETAARHLSVSLAAEELCVSQPAVSQQIKSLERQLGVRLVYREGQGLALTDKGRRFADKLHLAFVDIDGAIADLINHDQQGGTIVVSILPTLAQNWLIPRLGSFQKLHPHIDIRFSATARVVDLNQEDVDLAIRFGKGTWNNCQSRYMMANDMFPVLSPKLQQTKPIYRVADLAAHTWLWVEAEPRAADWQLWLNAAGGAGVQPKHRIGFETSSQALAAAAAGLGVAMGHRPFVMDDLLSERLMMPLDISLPSEEGYYLVTSLGDMAPRVRDFSDWLLSEVDIFPSHL